MTEELSVGREVYGGDPSRDIGRPESGAWRLDAVWALARPHDVAGSPDGSRFVFVLDHEGTNDLWSIDDDRGLIRLTTDRARTAYWDDSAPAFSTDGSLLAYDNGGWVHVLDLGTGHSRPLQRGTVGCWIGPQAMLIVTETADDCSTLTRVGLDDSVGEPLGPVEGEVTDPHALPDGRVLCTFHPKDDMNRSDVVIVEANGSWSTLSGRPDRRAWGARAHGDRIAYLREDEERSAIYLFDGHGHRLLAGGDVDHLRVEWARDGGSLVAIAANRGQTDLIGVGLDGTTTTIAKGGTWSEPLSLAHGLVAIHESWEAAPRLMLIDDAGQAQPILDGAPLSVRHAHPAAVERVSFPSLDGLVIEGFLSPPADISEPAPAIVYAHGGPTDAYGDQWDGHAQFFIERGYAWFGINFRGSTTYGLEFERANHGQCGVGDVDDCIAAGRYLASLEWIDPGRIVLFGPSYGAYLTVGALGRVDNPFACGVAKYGDYDMFTSWEQTDLVGRDEFIRLFGHPDQSSDAYRAGSVIDTVPQIEVPLLFIHGERDPRTHYKQAEQLLAELQRHDKTFEFVSYPTEAHGLLSRGPSIHFHRRMARFIDWHTRRDQP